MVNTYPAPSATIIAFGNYSGLEYGKAHIYESPVTEGIMATEKYELRSEILRGLGFAASRSSNGDSDIEIIAIPPITQ
jgi:hypothetical protein